MNKIEIYRYLSMVNRNIPPVFVIQYEKDGLILYAKEKLKILKKDGTPVVKLHKLEILLEHNNENVGNFLKGMIVLMNLSKRFSEMLEKQKMEKK